MKKPKFKLTIEEMLDFNDGCAMAASYHDNYSEVDDRVICLGEITAKQLVKRWLKSVPLFENGFDAELDGETLDVLDRWYQYKQDKQLWKALKKAGKLDD